MNSHLLCSCISACKNNIVKHKSKKKKKNNNKQGDVLSWAKFAQHLYFLSKIE